MISETIPVPSVSKIVERDGFAFLPEFFPSNSTAEIAGQLGSLLELPFILTVQQLTPKPSDEATPASYSGLYGLSEFPLHTDMAHWARPPHFLLLRCLEGSSNVATRLLAASEIAATVGEDTLRQALVRPRRPLNGRVVVLRLLQDVEDFTLLMRWDYVFIKGASARGRSGCEAVGSYLRDAISHDEFLAKPGDTLVVDNWRMLHGRSRVANPEQRRVIERAYLGTLN